MKVNHLRIYLSALRTSLIIVISLIAYELLIELEKEWNKMYPNNIYNFSKKKLLKLIIIFIFDIILLYLIFFIFKIQL